MKRVLTGLLITVLATLPVLAANPHYKPGRAVTCSVSTVSGGTLTGTCTSGEASGLGNEDLTFGVTASVSVGTFCHNKGNPSLIVPGQNPAIAQFANLQTIPGSTIKNGTFRFPAIQFSFTLNTPTPEEAGCPNSNWTVTLGTATWSAQYVVYQPFPNLVDALSFSF